MYRKRYIRLVLHHSWEWLFYIPPIARAILRVDIKMAVIIVLINSHEDIFAYISGHVLLDTIKIDLDMCRIHLEENHVPVFCTYNRFILYTVIFWLQNWNAEDSEGESKKNPVHFCAMTNVTC